MTQYKSREAWGDTRPDAKPADASSGPSPADERKEEHYELGDVDLSQSRNPAAPAKASPSALPWGAAALIAVSAGVFVVLAYLPLRRELRDKGQAAASMSQANAELSARVQELEKQRGSLAASQAELQATLQVKDQALAELEKTQAELAEKLNSEIQKGDVLIKQRAGELVVDLVDQILFDSGAAELNEKGKEVLRKVGETFIKVENKIIEIGGHTDAVPISPKLVARFPTNWELSAARALNVVRFLQDDVAVPGERLAATGFSQFRPVATNATRVGRRKNRRIEVVLLPTPAALVADRAKAAAEGKGKHESGD